MKKIKAILALYGALRLKNDIKLDDKIRVRRVDILNNEESLFRFVNWRAYGWATCPYDWVIELDYHYDEDLGSEPYPALLIKNNYIEYALRLFYKHDVGFAALVVDINNPNNYFVSNKMPSSVEFEKFDDIIEFSNFWERYTNAYQKKPAAYEYFSQSLNYPNSIKSVLFCSSLESLFVPDGERSKKRDFVLQGLKVLIFEQKDITIISELFEFRNAYIHVDKKEQLQLYSGRKYRSLWWEECEEVIRKVLFNHVHKPW